MSEIKYYSEEGLQKLKDELHHLIAFDRPAASAAIAEARDKGDLSEMPNMTPPKKLKGISKHASPNCRNLSPMPVCSTSRKSTHPKSSSSRKSLSVISRTMLSKSIPSFRRVKPV